MGGGRERGCGRGRGRGRGRQRVINVIVNGKVYGLWVVVDGTFWGVVLKFFLLANPAGS